MSDSDDTEMGLFNFWADTIVQKRTAAIAAFMEPQSERPLEDDDVTVLEPPNPNPVLQREIPDDATVLEPPQKPQLEWEEDEKEEEEEEKPKKTRRSCFMSDLKGSVTLKNNFPTHLLPLALRKFSIYGVKDVTLAGGEEGNMWMSSYVVKKLVDIAFHLSPKTIDNYFRTNSPQSHIGYVVSSRRIPEGAVRLSPSHKYLLIKLHFLKEWWSNSYTMQKIIQKTGKNSWPSLTASDDEEDLSDLSDSDID